MLRQPIKWKSHCVCAFILWLYIKCTGMASVMPFQIKQVNTTTKLTIGSDPEFYFVRLNESKTKEELLQAVAILENSTPSSWLVSPLVARGMLSTYYAVVKDHMMDVKNKYLYNITSWMRDC